MRRSLLAIAALIALALPAPSAADTVSDWMEVANRLGTAQPATPAPRTPDDERATTRTALAMFEAVNAIDRRYRSHLNFPAAASGASREAAAATAAFKVLHHHYAAQRMTLEESYALAMSAISDERARETGRAIGEAAAAAAIVAGGVDPAIEQTPYRPRTTPGEWVATSLPVFDPYWAAFRPWVISSAEALRPPPPPSLTSERWGRDYEEVRRLGSRNSTERTPHQTLVARYRRAFDATPALHGLADAPGRTLVQNARFFAIYQMALDDATHALVVAKLHYNFWRPVTAIRNGADDGNEATQPEPAWAPLLQTPNHPEYPCGHCTAAAAIAEVMKAEVGNCPVGGVRVGSDAIPNSVVQTFACWDAWAQEVSDSRIYAGVHYRFSNEAGEQIGHRAARIVVQSALQPLAARDRR